MTSKPQVLIAKAAKPSTTTPLVFVHGSYHAVREVPACHDTVPYLCHIHKCCRPPPTGCLTCLQAWCWAEHFMPYFSKRGYDCYALSLRGQASSTRSPTAAHTLNASPPQRPPHAGAAHLLLPLHSPPASPPQGASDLAPGTPAGGVAGTLEDHTADVTDFLCSLPAPAVLVGHSFGGLVVQGVLTRPPPDGAAKLAGMALLASVPPQGNSPMVARFLRTKPIASLKVTYSFISKAFERDEGICRETFFSKDMPTPTVRKCVRHAPSTKARLRRPASHSLSTAVRQGSARSLSPGLAVRGLVEALVR